MEPEEERAAAPEPRRIRWKLALPAGVLLAVSLLLGAILLLDFGFLEVPIERLVSERTGRSFDIEGPLRLRLGPRLRIRAAGLRLGNAPWAPEPQFLETGRLELDIETLALLRRRLVIARLGVEQLELNLRTEESGRGNWAMGARPGPGAPEGGGPGRPPLLLKEARVRDARVSFHSPARVAPLLVAVDEARQHLTGTGMIALELTGAMGDGQPIGLAGEAGPWPALLRGRELELRLGGRLGSAELRVEGFLDELRRPRRPRLDLDLRAASLAEFSRLFGPGVAAPGSVALAARLGPTRDAGLELDLEGQLGDFRIQAAGRTSDLQRLEPLALEARASAASLRPLLEALGIDYRVDRSLELDLAVRRGESELTVERLSARYGEAFLNAAARIPAFPALGDAAAHLELETPGAPELRRLLGLPPAFDRPMRLDAELATPAGREPRLRAGLESAWASITVDGRLGDGPRQHGSRGTLRLDTPELRSLAAAWGIDGAPPLALEAQGPWTWDARGLVLGEGWRLAAGDTAVEFSGVLVPQDRGSGSHLGLALRSPDAARLAREAGIAAPLPALPLTVTAALELVDGTLSATVPALELGSATARLQGAVIPGTDGPSLRLELAAEGPELEALIEDHQGLGVTPGPFSLTAGLRIAPGEVLLEDLALVRERATLRGRLGFDPENLLGSLRFDLRGSAGDVRHLLRSVGPLELRPQSFEIQATGHLGDARWVVETLEARLGQAAASARGRLDRDARTGEITLELTAPSLGALATRSGRDLPEGEVQLQARLTGDRRSLALDAVDVRLGANRLSGGATLDLVADGQRPKLEVTLDTLDLPPADGPGRAPAPAGERLIPPRRLELPPGLPALDLSVDAREARLRQLELTALRLDAELDEGSLILRRASAAVLGGEARARGYLVRSGRGAAAGLELAAEALQLVPPRSPADRPGTADLALALHGEGADLRQLAASLSGGLEARLADIRQGSHRFLLLLYGSLVDEILSYVNPFRSGQREGVYRCIYAPLRVDQGVVDSDTGAVMETGKVVAQVKLRVDLATEDLEATLRTTPKQLLSISAGEVLNRYFEITGTLAAPRLSLDEAGLVTSGGLALATGGLSLLARGLFDRVSRAPEPCAAAAELAREELADRLPDWSAPLEAPEPTPRPRGAPRPAPGPGNIRRTRRPRPEPAQARRQTSVPAG